MKWRWTAIITAAVLTVFPAFLPPSATVQANPLWPGYFELQGRAYSVSLPQDGAVWRAVSGIDADSLYVEFAQADYFDNGDAVVSSGDGFVGESSGTSRPSVYVGLVGRLYRLVENGWVLRPLLEADGSPVGQTWQIIAPMNLWGTEVVVGGWSPSEGHTEPGDGDGVNLDGADYTLEAVHLYVQGDYGVPVERTTWGRIKRFAKRLF